MTAITLYASAIGSLARRLIAEEKTATFLGISSRGVFLNIGLLWVIFLSYEPIRGPLTLNINQPIPVPVNMEQMQSIEIMNCRMYFRGLNIEVLVSNAKEWVVPSPPPSVLNSFERK
ncbi:MAG: hypothetical protein ACYC6L_12360 [Anaerolineae bacterium]